MAGTQVLPTPVSSGGGVPASTVVTETTFGLTSTVGLSTEYARADHTHGTVPAPNGMFGNGFDGDAGVAPTGATYTQTQERMWNNLLIPTGCTYKPAGFRVFVKETLTIEGSGSLNDDGDSAVAETRGFGLAARGYLDGTSTAGAAGYNLTTVQAGNGTTGGNIVSVVANQANVLPTGGAGGNSSTRTGGAAGTASIMTNGARLSQAWPSGRNPFAAMKGGSGGGSGAITLTVPGTSISGGGGAGGGIVVLFAKNIVNTGRISANGGNGGNANCPAGNNGGGGGGGGGGLVMVTTMTPASAAGTIQANGGTGGTGSGTGGTNGGNGTNGSVFFMGFGG